MPESGITKHNYLFCQFVNPACGHEGDRCDCYDTPSQRRTTLAKQRLARLRANQQINRASTSNDPESAVASDPAVTPLVFLGAKFSSTSAGCLLGRNAPITGSVLGGLAGMLPLGSPQSLWSLEISGAVSIVGSGFVNW